MCHAVIPPFFFFWWLVVVGCIYLSISQSMSSKFLIVFASSFSNVCNGNPIVASRRRCTLKVVFRVRSSYAHLKLFQLPINIMTQVSGRLKKLSFPSP